MDTPLRLLSRVARLEPAPVFFANLGDFVHQGTHGEREGAQAFEPEPGRARLSFG
jgi:hypothetical protein